MTVADTRCATCGTTTARIYVTNTYRVHDRTVVYTACSSCERAYLATCAQLDAENAADRAAAAAPARKVAKR